MNKNQIFGILIICFFLAVPSYAKQSQPPKKPITTDDIIAKMKQQLELTDQQVDQVKPIIENYLAQEKQLKLEEKKELSHVLTGQQLYTWDFIQNQTAKEKKKHSFP